MEAVDVIVLGTGGAGLTAALSAHAAGASVALFEKSEMVGGSTAWSGGRAWLPNNPHMADVGIADSPGLAFTYIMALSHGLIDPDLAQAYVDAAPDLVRFLESETPVQFRAVTGKPDYHAELPGGSQRGGRTVECHVFPFTELGEWAARVTPSPFYASAHLTVSEREGFVVDGGQNVAAVDTNASLRSDAEIARRRAADERGSGQALVGRLLKGCLDRGIAPRTSWRAAELIMEAGAIVGVRFATAKGDETVRANRGVILATGGFEWNSDYVRKFLRGPMTNPVSVPTNEGDGLRMALKVGAMPANMREAWWMPVTPVPREVNPFGWVSVSGDRALPGTIMINREGRRFTNEAVNYNTIGAAFHVLDVSRYRYANLPCWMIFDHAYVRRYGFGQWSPRGTAPYWAATAPTLAGLADKIDIPPAALEATVERWNDGVTRGEDLDFHRGENAFDRFWGAPQSTEPDAFATLGPIAEGPFYALEIRSGALGTKGGPQVDRDSRVLDTNGDPIPGLYAAGNVMASPFGMSYGGAGGTIGQAMVFGYLAGKHAGGRC